MSSSFAATDPFLLLSVPVITNGQLQVTLQAESGVSYVIETSPDLQNWSPVLTNSDTNLTRLITLSAPTDPAFARALRQPLPVYASTLAAKSYVNLQGNSIHFDSYDSSDPVFSTSGHYDPLKAKAGGDIACEGYLNVANADINGRLRTGPAGNYAFGPSGYAGPIGWPGPGLYSSDWYRNDYRFTFPEVAPPFANGMNPSSQGTTNYWVLDSGDYFWNGNVLVPSRTNILVTGSARLYVSGEFRMTSTSMILFSPGSTLKLYSGGGRLALGLIENACCVEAFQCYGLLTVTNATWSGSSSFTGVIYTPQATLTVGGGGSTIYDFAGACVVDQAVVNGHVNFHFDENLMRAGPMR